MLLNFKFKLDKSPPTIFWIVIFILSFAAMLYLGLSPELIVTNWYILLASFNVLMSLIASYFVFINIRKIKINNKKNIIGFKFTWTFIRIVPLLVLFPLISFYVFSFAFVKDNLNKAQEQFDQFNITVSGKVDELYRNTNNVKSKYYFDKTINIAKLLDYVNTDDLNTAQIKQILNKLIEDGWACELNLYDRDMVIITSTENNSKCLQTPYTASFNDFILIANYIADASIENLNNKMLGFRNAAKNANLKLNSSIIQKRFILHLSSTIFLGILIALLIAFRLIEQLILPMHNLSLATREIAKGNYGVKIKNYPKSTDLKDLILSFNDMSKKVKDYREGLDTHNLYLETILKYSAGVLSLNTDKKTINIINPIILKMLHIKEDKYFVGKSYTKIIKKYKYLQPLFSYIEKNIDKNLKEWKGEIALVLPDRNILIYCQGASLDIENNNLGYVIVINDISKLHRAQKKAAWGEVAVRMAHEIKNPLTPIMLSAQRLRNVFLDKLKDKDYEIVEKTTNTIIDQVKSMSSMVSSFADYANTPKIEKKLLFLNTIINKVASLYDAQNDVSINLNLSGNLPKLYLDENAISRVLINLIKNSIEAIDKKRKLNIFIKTYYRLSDNIVVMTIIDDGNGFDEKFINTVFEPYITTKKKGSGLGLVIVQNVIDQHNGQIYASNVEPYGARITIEFNIIENEQGV